MVFLTDGTLMTWDEIQPHIPDVKRQASLQFLHQYRKYKDLKGCPFFWGDEIEYSLVKFDHSHHGVQLLHSASTLLDSPQLKQAQTSDWSPEYGEYMLEGKPKNPYTEDISQLTLVEPHLKERRRTVNLMLGPNERMVTLTTFPRLGCPGFTFPPYEANKHAADITESIFVANEARCSPFPLFQYAGRNFVSRKQERMNMNVPLFQDEKTIMPYGEDMTVYGHNPNMEKYMKPGHIYMDALLFGTGCCSLQVTMQAPDLKEATMLYDNLIPLTPIMLAFTAAAPIHRGFLSNTDCRWSTLSQSCDDRTLQERGLEPLTNGNCLVETTRFDTVCSYLSVSDQFYNDFQYSYDEQKYKQLKDEGVDDMMARYVAWLLIRDPMMLYKERLDQDVTLDTEHIQSIIASNWHTIKLKLPDDNSGWKIEFRTMELQLTDFENAALSVFVVLLSRAILASTLNLLVPITKVKENMETAQLPDAMNTAKFYFRQHVQRGANDGQPCDNSYQHMTINEIFNGKEDYPGLLPLIHQYLDTISLDADTRPVLNRYLNFISDKAAGKIMTMAQWTRQFVRNHEDYKKDSVVNERITYDLLVECERAVNSEDSYPHIFVKPQ
ncbi:glutamate--cysteine ligase catalytic subunit-like [Argonauta hians]